MNIAGTITGIKYKVLLTEDLEEVFINHFDINEMPSACLLNDNKHTFAISKWVSPKRSPKNTISYQYFQTKINGGKLKFLSIRN